LIEPYLRVLSGHSLVAKYEEVFRKATDRELRGGDLETLKNRPLERGYEGERCRCDRGRPIAG
jgi:hypothetical protein